MKLQTAIASVIVTEGISRSLFPVQADARILRATNRFEMIQATTSTEQRLDERTKRLDERTKKRRSSLRLLGQWQQQQQQQRQQQQRQRSLESEMKEQNEQGNNNDGQGELDLGILAPFDSTNKKPGRLESPLPFDPCNTTVEEIRDYVYFIAKNPIKSALERSCRSFRYQFGQDVCKVCEVVEHSDDGTYEFMVDCPKLTANLECINENGCKGDLGLDISYNRHRFCRPFDDSCPECGTLCECNFEETDENYERTEWHCQELSYEMRVAREKYNGEPVDLEFLVDFLLYEVGYMDLILADCPTNTMVPSFYLDEKEEDTNIMDEVQTVDVSYLDDDDEGLPPFDESTEYGGAASADKKHAIALSVGAALASAALGYSIYKCTR